LRKNLRDADLICRTGGEEFLVALPKTTKAQASATADRLRQAVGALDISIDGMAKPLRVTVSIGLSVQEGNVPITDMLEQADRALYQAKARGRNVVAIATAA
jgi:two-component system cell cycle response regulator